MKLLEVRDLRVSYGDGGHIKAVRGVSFGVERGQAVALIGPNGAGKSSVLSALSGLARAESGSVLLEGRELLRAPSHSRVAAGLVLVPEGRAMLSRMTVLENLTMGAEGGTLARTARKAAIDGELQRFPSLARRASQPAGALSGGEQQMLAIARALLMRPRLLALDEPSMGLSPKLVEEIFAALAALHREGVSLLLVEQNARRALELANVAHVLERGEIVLSGTADEVKRDPRVREVYLGG